jgi:hypothetical protein
MATESNDGGTTTAAGRGARRVGLAAGLLAVTLLVPGCFVDGTHSDPGYVCYDGRIQASWSLSENGQPVQCGLGDRVFIIVDGQSVDFPCSDHTGTTPLVAGDAYHDVSLALYDANNVRLSKTLSTMSLYVGCGQVLVTQDVDFSLTPLP